MQVAKKKKYALEDYISYARGNPIIKAYNLETGSKTLTCLCGRSDGGGAKCLRCGLNYHYCLANKPNRGNQYECFSCLNKHLDPLYQVSKVLVECVFKTENIFEYQNYINLQFTLRNEDMGQPIQLRGLRPGITGLAWPMQGCFFLNDQATPFYDIKPLLTNSNRKTRREQYFTIPMDKLRLGVNFIRFRIYNLDRNKFTSKYQYEDRQVYYFALNKIKIITENELVAETFQLRRMELKQSTKLLQSGGLEVIQQKVCLTCPYTRQRIQTPVRGRHCIHFNCICLRSLVATHINHRFWSCPICEQRINEPVVDMWVVSMLKDNQAGSDVIVNPNGTYHWLEMAPKAMILDSDEEEQMQRLEKERVEKEIIEKERIEKERIEKERIEKEKTQIERINREREALIREKIAISLEKARAEMEEKKRAAQIEMIKQEQKAKQRQKLEKQRQKKEKEIKEKQRQKEKERQRQQQREKERQKNKSKASQKMKLEHSHQTGRKTVAPRPLSPPTNPNPQVTIDIESDFQPYPFPPPPSQTPSDPRVRRTNPSIIKIKQKLKDVHKKDQFSKPHLHEQDRYRTKRDLSLNENKRMQVITDIRTLQIKEMSRGQLHMNYFKNRKRELRKSNAAYFQDHRALATLFNFSFT